MSRRENCYSWRIYGLFFVYKRHPPIVGLANGGGAVVYSGVVAVSSGHLAHCGTRLFTSILATFGISIMIQQLMNLFFGADVQVADAGFDTLFLLDSTLTVPYIGW